MARVAGFDGVKPNVRNGRIGFQVLCMHNWDMAYMQSNSRNSQLGQPVGVEVARYNTYLEAQRAVDYLSDQQFDVKAVTIVGSDLQMVERIIGRKTYASVAAQGAASGAWFGLFVGIMLYVFSSGGNILNSLIPGLLIGAGFGMLFGVVAHAMTGGKRDFNSTSRVVANSFQVLCLAESAPAARTLIENMPAK